MSSLIAKLETDPVARVRAVKIVSNAMAIVSAAAALIIGYLTWVI